MPFFSEGLARVQLNDQEKFYMAGRQFWRTFQSWVQNRTYCQAKALSLIIYWGIWFTKNNALFQDKSIIPKVVASQSLGILSQFPQEKEGGSLWNITEEVINKNFPWGLFDGAAQGSPTKCGGE